MLCVWTHPVEEMTTTEDIFDTIPITVEGVYRFGFRSCTGEWVEGDLNIKNINGRPMIVHDKYPGILRENTPFSKYAKLPGAGWYFKCPLS